jgi:hypothetical protein
VKQRTPWLVCVFVPLIALDRQLGIYCNAPGYKVRTYNTEELADDKKTKFPEKLFLTKRSNAKKEQGDTTLNSNYLGV